MKISFPRNFIFGTSTASYQIETAVDHDWQGIRSRDGHVFDRTTDHEKRFIDDAKLIASLAPNYRMSLMWSKLQAEPLGKFDASVVQQYHLFLQTLVLNGVSIMMVLHHFTNPNWFSQRGGWEKEENIALWVDFCKKLIDEFGEYVSYWNTFNEPNVYASYGWVVGEFPPFKTNPVAAFKVVKNMGKGHDIVFDYIKSKFPDHPVGLSNNTTIFSYENFLGWIPAKLSDLWFMEFIPRHFEKCDFFGMSYYARISHDPFPITYIETPHKIKKLGKDHDDMWEYYPEGLGESMLRYWRLYKKPIIVTENGVCTSDDQRRTRAIQEYMRIIHQTMNAGVDVRGYFYWSPWDNFEWHLGPTYRFGLYECDLKTKNRIKRPSADLFSKLAYSREIEIDSNLISAAINSPSLKPSLGNY
ncbi:MAG TPA: family 1 glycosylhydrolase [Cyclobacteriaceae bacterium]|nr:family 1 glycosylhydrolase [Cyclobacteriaceae bacterium]